MSLNEVLQHFERLRTNPDFLTVAAEQAAQRHVEREAIERQGCAIFGRISAILRNFFVTRAHVGGEYCTNRSMKFLPLEPRNWRCFVSQQRCVNAILLSLLCSALAACSTTSSQSSGLLTGPSVLAWSDMISDVITANSDGSHAIPLLPLVGTGSGLVNVIPTAQDGGFAAHFRSSVNVHGVAPDTLLYLQFSPDGGLGSQQADGICQRAAGGLFFPVALYTDGPPATITTSSGGAGAVHLELHFNAPFFPEGSRGDVVWRLINALPPAVPTIDLRTPCFMFEIK